VEAPADLPVPLPLRLSEEPSRLPLGTLLVRDGLISAEQLEYALAEKEQTGRRLGEIFVSLGWVAAGELARLLAEQHGLQYIDLPSADVDPGALSLLPEKYARRYEAPAGRPKGRGRCVSPVMAVQDGQSKSRMRARYWLKLGRRELASL
jgi:hypothetical protein